MNHKVIVCMAIIGSLILMGWGNPLSSSPNSHKTTSAIQQEDITKLRVFHRKLGVDNVQVQRGIKYKTNGQTVLTFDLYSPPSDSGLPNRPVVIFVFGYPDSAIMKMSGMKLRDWEQYISWGKLVAASLLNAIIYETTNPIEDIGDLVKYIRENADSLKINANSVGIWSCSGNVPLAQWYLNQEPRTYLKCAVLYYGSMITADQKYQHEAESLAKKAGFILPKLENVEHLHQTVPMLVVRAGKDMPVFNQMIDHFLSEALIKNAAITLINYAAGQHAFDIRDNTQTTRRIVRQTIDFLKTHLIPVIGD
jgi:dienelactone hydrolase